MPQPCMPVNVVGSLGEVICGVKVVLREWDRDHCRLLRATFSMPEDGIMIVRPLNNNTGY